MLKLTFLSRSHILQYGTGYAISAGSRLLRDLLLFRILGPANFGLWAGLSIIRQYSAYSDLGFTNGLGRLLPLQLHEGRVDEARATMGSAWIVAMAATALFAVGALVWARPQVGAGNWPVFWGTVTLVALMFFEKQQMYSSTVFSSTQRVGEAGLFMGLLGIVELILCVILASWRGLYGLYAALLIAIALTVLLMAVRQQLHARLRLDFGALPRLAVVSIVMMGYGLTNVALHNIDRVAILLERGADSALGAYHLALSVSLVVNYAPYIVLTVLIPRMFRHGGDKPHELRPFVLMPTAMVAVCSVTVAALVWVFVPALTALVGVHIERAYLGPLLIAETAFSMSMVAANVTLAVDRGSLGLMIRLATISVGFFGSIFLLSQNQSLAAIAWLMALAQCLGALALGVLIARITALKPSRVITVMIAPATYAFIVVTAFTHIAGTTTESLAPGILSAVVVSIGLIPLALVPIAYAGRGAALGEHLRDLLQWRRDA